MKIKTIVLHCNVCETWVGSHEWRFGKYILNCGHKDKYNTKSQLNPADVENINKEIIKNRKK